MSIKALDDAALAQLFGAARTFNHFSDRAVEDSTLYAIYEQMKFAPTSANCCPARFLFIKSAAAKEKLKPALDDGNRDKTIKAPVTVIVAHDMAFYEQLPKLYLHEDAKSWFVGKDAVIATTAFRNGTLQGAYLMLAARALGLDCGPMSGFDNARVDADFFADSTVKSNFLINLGYGDRTKLHPRNPRLDFAAACSIV